MKIIINKAKEILKNLNLRQRMILVYIIGCILPILVVYVYMYNASINVSINQELRNENDKLKEHADNIIASMDMAVELSEKLYYDDAEDKIAIKQYTGNSDIKAGYRDFENVSGYLDYYYRDIYGLVVYLNKDVADGKKIIDNRRFKLITDTIQQKQWYTKTIESLGAPSWSYWTNTQNGKVSLRLTRVLYTKYHRPVGVISIALEPELTMGYIEKLDELALIVLNGEKLVCSNRTVTEGELNSVVSAIRRKDFDGWMDFRGERCVTSAVNIDPRYSKDSYLIITLKSYEDVVSETKINTMFSFLPLVFALVITSLAISLLTNWFSKRISALTSAVHKVVEGDYDVENSEIGESRDEIWNLYNDLNYMICDMQRLMQTAADERIQKEQLYSRQRDVEFKMLSTQINPHFLYNTLENIRMLACINHQEEIADISVRLTKLLRGSLSAGQGLKTLAWEMEMVECYIVIQNYRFGDRIEARLSYDNRLAEKLLVLPFVIQPFVENAYVHAMEDKEEDGIIDISMSVGENLCLIVEDNGHGMSETELAEVIRYLNDFDNLDRTHIGICNVNQRIKLRFGDEYGVVFESTENVGTRVQIKMPLIEND